MKAFFISHLFRLDGLRIIFRVSIYNIANYFSYHKEKQRGCPLLDANKHTHIYQSYICIYQRRAVHGCSGCGAPLKFQTFRACLSIPRPNTAMNAARHKIISFFETSRFLYTYWKTYLIQSGIFFFSKISRNWKIIPKVLEKLKGRFLIFNVKKYMKISEKIIAFVAYFDSIFIRYKYFTCKLSYWMYGAAMRDWTERKFNNAYLLKCYENYLTRNEFNWLHNSYSLYGNMNLYIGT